MMKWFAKRGSDEEIDFWRSEVRSAGREVVALEKLLAHARLSIAGLEAQVEIQHEYIAELEEPLMTLEESFDAAVGGLLDIGAEFPVTIRLFEVDDLGEFPPTWDNEVKERS